MLSGEYAVVTEELSIPSGEREIYGVCCTPDAEGTFPTVILSHGYNGSSADFVKECTYFASSGFRAVAFDFCGGSVNSRSSGASADMTVFTEKEDLLAVIDYVKAMEKTDAEKLFLFGASQGGFVSGLAAAERAEDIRSMVLYFPALCIPDDWRKTYPTETEIPDSVDFWGLTIGKKFFMSIREMDPFEIIGRYHKNVLIVHGDEDPIVPLSYSLRAQETYESAQLVIFPKEGHGFSPAYSAEAAELALRFMQKNCGIGILP